MPRTLIGILFCIGSMFSFAIQDIVTKTLLVGGLPLGQLLLVRYILFFAFALVLAGSLIKAIKSLKSNQPFAQIGRAGLSLGEIAMINLALGMMPVAQVHGIVALFPIIGMLMAWWFLKERLVPLDLIAVCVGFGGALILIQPGGQSFDKTVLLPLTGATLLASYGIASKYLSSKDSLTTHTIYIGLVCLLVSLPIGLYQWKSPNYTEWWLLAALSGLNILSQMMFIKAMEFADAATLQPFNYTLLLFATIFAALLLDEIPRIETLIGAGLIVAGGLMTMMKFRTKTARLPD